MKKDRVKKPWGGYEIIEKGKEHWLKKLFVRKGEMLSLQSHNERSETWVVLTGKIRAQKGNTWRTLNEGDSITINRKEKHRIAGLAESCVLEVALGRPKEHDITRYKDKYGRNT